MTTPYVIGIGNAVMDVIAPTRDETLARLGVERGIMQLIDRERSEFLMAAQSADPQAGKARLVPGGSVANTLAGLGMMGLRTAFIGKVAGDPLANEAGGLSDAPVLEQSTLVLRRLRSRLPESVPLIGVGGILSGADAVAKMAAGAALVQCYSGLIYRGPALIGDCVDAIRRRRESPSRGAVAPL